MTTKQGQEFMEKTRYEYLDTSDQNKGLPQPPLQLNPDPSETLIDLPPPESIKVKNLNLRDAIEKRQSIRMYKDQPLTLEELSWLLWCTQGVKEVIPRPATKRNVPSAGARHCFETYVLANNVEELIPGLYRFIAIQHKLVKVNTEDKELANKLAEAALRQSMVKNSAVTFFWTVVAYRMKWRYTERGYRYMHLDAGHVCQNLYLAAENIDCGACAIAAFHDLQLNDLLGLDGIERFAIYLATVGKK